MLILSANPLHEDEATRARTWEARTRHRRCRTRVRRGGTRRRAGDATARASSHVGPRGSHVVFTDARRREPIRLRCASTRADSGWLGPESAGIGRYRPKQPIPAEIQKKKKKKNLERTVFTEIQNTLLPLRLTHFVSVLVCSLPLCLSVSSPSLPLCV